MKTTIILTVIGATTGFLYASVAGCETACATTASQYAMNTTVYGAVAGLVLAFPIKKKLNK